MAPLTRAPRRVTAAVLLAACASLLVGCDPEPAPSPASQPTTAATAAQTPPAAGETQVANAQRAARLDAEPRERIELIAIPFTIEAPKSWLVQAGVANKIVLHGMTPSGEVDILLGSQPKVTDDGLAYLLKQSSKPSTNPHVKNEVSEHDGIKFIKQVEPQGTGTTDPDLIPMRWTITCIISGEGRQSAVYDLNIIGLSQAMFDHDERFIQAILDTLRYEAASTRPAVP